MCSTSTCAKTRTICGILPGSNLLSMCLFLDSSPEHHSALSHRLLSTLPLVLLQVLYLQGSPQSASTSGGPHRSSPNSCSFVEDVLAPKIVSTEDETLRRFSSVAVPQPCMQSWVVTTTFPPHTNPWCTKKWSLFALSVLVHFQNACILARFSLRSSTTVAPPT